MSRDRRMEDDEMLVTHEPPEAKDRAERTEATVESDPAVLEERLRAAQDPTERKRLIREIQERLGNREAARVIRAAAAKHEEGGS